MMSGQAPLLGGLLVAAAATACGGELSGATWVREPEGGGSLGETVTLEHGEIAEYRTSDALPKGGPARLDHTVTLGEVDATGPAPVPAAPAAPGAPTQVTVNVNNYVQHGAAGYYAETPVFVPGSARSTSASRGRGSSGVRPGQDWPAPKSYGPTFPYQTSPASPWESKR